MVSDEWVHDLLREDWRHVDGDAEVAAHFAGKPGEGPDEGDIALQHGFVDPFLPVRPAPGETAVRQMGMEDEGCGSGHVSSLGPVGEPGR